MLVDLQAFVLSASLRCASAVRNLELEFVLCGVKFTRSRMFSLSSFEIGSFTHVVHVPSVLVAEVIET